MNLIGYSLVNKITNTVAQNFTSIPKKVRYLTTSVHSPSVGDLHGNHALLERYEDKSSGDVFVNKEIQVFSTHVLEFSNYRDSTLSEVKTTKINEVVAEASSRRKSLLPGMFDTEEVIFDALSLVNDKVKGKVLSPKRQAKNDLLEGLQVQRDAITDAADAAVLSINSATTIEDVNAVTVVWP